MVFEWVWSQKMYITSIVTSPLNKIEHRDGAAAHRLTDVSLLSTPHLYLI